MGEEPPAGAELEPSPEAGSRSHYTVFAGSSQEDVAYAKVFWSSLSLQPPLESRLVSGDIKQRLKVAQRGGQCCHCKPTQADIKSKQLLIEAHMQLKAEEKARYFEKAKKREEILELINKQREERIKKELLALPYKPKRMVQSPRKPACPESSSDAQETYQALRQFD
ncbi:cilia- and flagella-associated protein HOATZ [Heptranchias perlo]|uniref:cilia- and flagella-associated protein HOATZ n=1 Tax=Heptranchias perlo TaxID=212740 RepID=UPI00355AB4E4